MQINIRDSLNRMDYDTDNRFDLLNRYNVANLSQEQRAGLAQSIYKGASAKEISGMIPEVVVREE